MQNYKIITDFQSLINYKESWDLLLENSNADKLFMSFDWVYEWLSSFGNDKKLNVYFIYNENVLIGILPLIIRRKEGFNHLNLLGNGKSDFLDFIFHKDYQTECINFFVDFVLGKSKGWDLFNCSQLLEDSITNIELINKLYVKNSFGYSCKRYSVAPYISINDIWDNYKNSLSKNILSDTKRRFNRV